jgi:hypothetical protein
MNDLSIINTDKLASKLEAHSIPYKRDTQNSILIEVCFREAIKIEFNSEGRVLIKELAKSYNIHSGPIPLTFSKQLIFSTFAFIVVGIVVCWITYTRPPIIPIVLMILFIGSILFLFWGLYGVIKMEAMKNLIRNFIDHF